MCVQRCAMDASAQDNPKQSCRSDYSKGLALILTCRTSAVSKVRVCAWPCAGSAHLIAITFLATRLAYVRSSRADRFKLTGVAWWLHLLQAATAAACLLITLFLLNGRLATSRASLIPSARARGVSPYEWVGERRLVPYASAQ